MAFSLIALINILILARIVYFLQVKKTDPLKSITRWVEENTSDKDVKNHFEDQG